MQTSRELVKAAIHFNNPHRLPKMFDAFGVNDTYHISWKQIGTGDKNIRKTVDEWGCIWERTAEKNMGQVTSHPLENWDDLNTYKWFDPDDSALYEDMADRFEKSDDKYIKCGIFMVLFERMHSLHGFENTLMDFYINREKIEYLADRIVEIQLKIIDNIASMFPNMIDGIDFTDDWGTERKLIISPQLWREFFKPRYKKIFDACHKAGWDVWMHSCGKVNEILDDWIETGVNVFNLQQPTLLGIEDIGKKFAGRVCFQSLCDIQMTLPFKSDKEIKDEAKLLIDNWGTDKGGFILADYGDNDALGTTPYNKRVMYNAFDEYDRWKNAD